MTVSPTETVEVDAKLLERVRRAARERGVSFRELIQTAIERELNGEETQPPLSLIGAFSSGRGDLSKLASEDVFEPEPFR